MTLLVDIQPKNAGGLLLGIHCQPCREVYHHTHALRFEVIQAYKNRYEGTLVKVRLEVLSRIGKGKQGEGLSLA